MAKKNKKDTRRSALKKIASSSGLFIGAPYSAIWASPNSGRLAGEIGEMDSIASPSFATTTTCPFITTVGSTTTSGTTTSGTTTSGTTTPP